MRKDAEAHADEDKAKREEVERATRRTARCIAPRKMLKDNADKISGDDKSKIEKAVAEVKKR